MTNTQAIEVYGTIAFGGFVCLMVLAQFGRYGSCGTHHGDQEAKESKRREAGSVISCKDTAP